MAEIRKLARYISDATDTDEFEASWQGRDLNDLAGHVQDSRGETVRCSLHDVKVKVASFFVDGSLQKTVVTVPLPSNVLITEHHAANDPQTGADKWIDLSLIGIAPASPSTATSQLLAPATASPSTAMSQLDYSQLDQSSSSVALGKLNRPCRLERIIRNKMIAEINTEYKSVKSKTKDESRKNACQSVGSFSGTISSCKQCAASFLLRVIARNAVVGILGCTVLWSLARRKTKRNSKDVNVYIYIYI